MKYTDIFLSEICKNGEYSFILVDDKIILLPREDLDYYMPKIFIESKQQFEDALINYIGTIKTSSIGCYKLDGCHRINNFMFYLMKNLTNEDCLDFIGYVNRVTDFINDHTFDNLSEISIIGKIGDYDLLARRCEEYYGSETPYTMRLYLEIPGFRFELPLIRYAIDSEKTAYIYCIQRKRIYKANSPKVLKINKMFNEVNCGIKENRNITPAMLGSLAIFLTLLKNEGITKIKADGFLTRRYGHLHGISTDAERDKILYNSIDKYFRLFERIEHQSKGIEITAYPLDIDSYIHLKLNGDLSSSNPILDEIYSTSKHFIITKKD